jgi:DNA-binding CsgD family transcriptional regulator
MGTGTEAFGLADWSAEVSYIIEGVDRDDLPARLIKALRHIVPFELAIILVYRGRSRPIIVYDNFCDAQAKRGLANYANMTYVLNPFYLAHLRGVVPGVYRISDLAPDGFFESEAYKTQKITRSRNEEIGYITDDWPRDMEELNIGVRLADRVTAEIALHRPVSAGGFSEVHKVLLAELQPVFAAAFSKYWAVRRGGAARSTDTRVDEAFDNFGRGVLTERERQTMQLVLRGHSSKSISCNLEISVTTVKTYRKRAYAKLGICSQSQLLSLFIGSLERDGTFGA